MLATNNNYYYQQTINEQVIVLLVWFAFQRGWTVKKKMQGRIYKQDHNCFLIKLLQNTVTLQMKQTFQKTFN